MPRSIATIVDITGTEICASLTCPLQFLENSNISFIFSENFLQSVKRTYIPGTDSQIVGLNSFAAGSSLKSVHIRSIFSVLMGMWVFGEASKASVQLQNLIVLLIQIDFTHFSEF